MSISHSKAVTNTLIKIKMLLNYFSLTPYEFYCLKIESRAAEVGPSYHYYVVPNNVKLFPPQKWETNACAFSAFLQLEPLT